MLRTKFQKKFVFEKIIMLSNYFVNFKKIFRMRAAIKNAKFDDSTRAR